VIAVAFFQNRNETMLEFFRAIVIDFDLVDLEIGTMVLVLLTIPLVLIIIELSTFIKNDQRLLFTVLVADSLAYMVLDTFPFVQIFIGAMSYWYFKKRGVLSSTEVEN
jgi:hypothetical protein